MKRNLLLIVLILFAVPAWAGPEMVSHEYDFTAMNVEDEANAIPMQEIIDLPFGIKDVSCPPSPYRVWEEPKTTEFPHSAMGKIFLSMNGKTYVCSGALIDVDVVLTAGHCVVNNGVWHSGLYFAPGYRGGSPLGRYRAVASYAWKSWIYNKDYRYDYAIVVIESEPGHSVGVLPTAWSAPIEQLWWQTGYPADWGYDGNLLWYNESPTGGYMTYWGEPYPLLTGTGLAPGCSGGPWLAKFGDTWRINSINSAGYESCPNMIQGPYFNDNFPVMMDAGKAYK